MKDRSRGEVEEKVKSRGSLFYSKFKLSYNEVRENTENGVNKANLHGKSGSFARLPLRQNWEKQRQIIIIN